MMLAEDKAVTVIRGERNAKGSLDTCLGSHAFLIFHKLVRR